MTCDEALERLLEADPAALDGGGDGELGQHLEGCARCARIAGVLKDELETLDRELAAWAGDGAAAARAADAALEALSGGGTVPADAWPVDARPRSRGWKRWAWIPAAAAAALGGVLLLGRGPEDDGGPPPRVAAVRPAVAVRPPADRAAAILSTGDPEITIVWLYDREE